MYIAFNNHKFTICISDHIAQEVLEITFYNATSVFIKNLDDCQTRSVPPIPWSLFYIGTSVYTAVIAFGDACVHDNEAVKYTSVSS